MKIYYRTKMILLCFISFLDQNSKVSLICLIAYGFILAEFQMREIIKYITNAKQ